MKEQTSQLGGSCGPRCRYSVVGMVLGIGCLISAAVFFSIRAGEQFFARQQFEQNVNEHILLIHRMLDQDFLALQSVALLYHCSDTVSHEEFTEFTSPLLKYNIGVQSFQWAPRTLDAKTGKDHFLVAVSEPKTGRNANTIKDFADNAACLETIHHACDTGQFAMSAPIAVPRDLNRHIGTKLMLPVYAKGATLDTASERRKNLIGVVVGDISPKHVVEEGIFALAPSGIDLWIVDTTNPAQPMPLYYHRSRLRLMERALPNEAAGAPENVMQTSKPFEVAGRHWTVTCAVAPHFLFGKITWVPWNAAFACLFLTGILAAYFASVIHRDAESSQLAAELKNANQQLELEIAERIQTETSLRTSQTKYKAIYEYSSDAIVLLTADTFVYLCGNPAAVALFGCKDENELVGCTLMTFSPQYQPDGGASAGHVPEIAAATSREGSLFFEWMHCRKDGTEFPATVLLTKMTLDGQAVFQATVRDVTQQKKMEQTLRASERRLRLFAENVGDVIWTMDLVGRFTYVSPSGERMLGYPWREGSRLVFTELVAPQHAAALKQTFDNFLIQARIGRKTENISIEVELIRKNGTTFWAEVTFGGLYDELGELDGVMGITRDITVRRQMAEDLHKAKDAAEAATQAKSRFLATVSHEIRTPMTAILGYADLLMDPTTTDEKRGEYAGVIRRNGEHLLALINDVLDLSKIEAGRLSVDLRRCNLGLLLADVASVVRPRALQRGITLSVEYATAIPENISTDAVRLRQAVLNLVGNAVKFTEVGGVRVVTTFLPTWRDSSPAVRIDVIDTGIGIRKDILPKLFQPFVQGEMLNPNCISGTGLGLAISRQIAQLLGGDLTVQSEVGKGSVFTLIVPTGDAQNAPMLTHPSEAELKVVEERSPAIEALANVRILLAEDGCDNRDLIENVLRRAGAKVVGVENGRQAVAEAEANMFDVILMDINMPEMDGYAATRMLRERGYRRPILALTANAMADDNAKCREAGCDEHIPKPINRRQLIQTIAEHAYKKLPEDQQIDAMLQAPSKDSVMISQYSDDPEIAMILGDFVSRLECQLDAMRRAYANGEYQELQRFAHRMKGAGGSYGYPLLTDAAKSLEDAAKSQDQPAAAAALNTVVAMCHAIQKGYAGETPAGKTPP